ncbi:MAG: hypothetical protein ACREPG_07375 [Candidatus Binatia bacterium]
MALLRKGAVTVVRQYGRILQLILPIGPFGFRAIVIDSEGIGSRCIPIKEPQDETI